MVGCVVAARLKLLVSDACAAIDAAFCEGPRGTLTLLLTGGGTDVAEVAIESSIDIDVSSVWCRRPPTCGVYGELKYSVRKECAQSVGIMSQIQAIEVDSNKKDCGVQRKISLTERSCQLNQQSQARNHTNLTQLSMANDGFENSIRLVTGRAMSAQERLCFEGTPILKGQVSAFHMLRDCANVVKETG